MDVGTQTVSGLGEPPPSTRGGVVFRDRSGETSGAKNREGGEDHRSGRGRYPANGSRRYSLSQADRPAQYGRRRNSERYSHNPYNPSFKRRHYRGGSGGGGGRERIVLPTKFLLGGNINDPLNLNSLADEAVSRILNAPTPVPSPSTAPVRTIRPDPPLEIIRPANLQDPLNLSAAADDEGAASAAVLIPNSSRRKRRRHRKHNQKNKSDAGGSVVAPPPIRNHSCDTQTAHPLAVTSRRSSTGAASYGFARRSNIADRIVSPVVPQVSPRQKRRRTLSEEKPDRYEVSGKRFMNHSRGGGNTVFSRMNNHKSGDGDKSSIVGDTVSEKSDQESGSNNKKINNNNKTNKRRRLHSATESQQPKKYRAADEKFVHGNYVAYYGYRNPTGGVVLPDPRLKVLPEGLLEGKDVLDVGCNVGHVTLCIARDYNPRRIVGVDIDSKLIAMAKKNIRHYMDSRTEPVNQQQQRPMSQQQQLVSQHQQLGIAEGLQNKNKSGILKDTDGGNNPAKKLNSEVIKKRSVSFATGHCSGTCPTKTVSSDATSVLFDDPKTTACNDKPLSDIEINSPETKTLTDVNKLKSSDTQTVADGTETMSDSCRTVLDDAKPVSDASDVVLDDTIAGSLDSGSVCSSQTLAASLECSKNCSDSVDSLVNTGTALSSDNVKTNDIVEALPSDSNSISPTLQASVSKKDCSTGDTCEAFSTNDNSVKRVYETFPLEEDPGNKSCRRSPVRDGYESLKVAELKDERDPPVSDIPPASDAIKMEIKSEKDDSCTSESLSSKQDDKVLDTDVDTTAVDNTAVDNAAVDNAAVDNTAVDTTAVDNTAVDNAVVDNTAVDNTAVDNTAVDNTAVDNTATARNTISKHATAAEKEISAESEVVQIFPVSMEILYGPLSSHQVAVQSPAREPIREEIRSSTCSTLKSKSAFPQNVMFQAVNYVPENEEVVTKQRPEYDVILALSVTKWMHLNSGDEGLKRAFRRMFAQLRPGGRLVLEAQSWSSYKKKKKLSESIFKAYQSIKFFPEHFVEYLLSSDVGFSSCRLIGVPYNMSKGFQRPIHIFTKKGPE